MTSRNSRSEPVNWSLVRQRLQVAMEVTAGRWDPSPEARQRNLEARAKAFTRARQAESGTRPAIGAICFRLSGRRYTIEARYVNEVILLETLTPLPRTPNFVAGVYNLRGRLLPVFDLRLALALESTTTSAEQWSVACGRDQPEFLLLTDTIANTAQDLPDVASNPEDDADPAWVLGTAADGTAIIDGASLLDDRQFFLKDEESVGPVDRMEGKE